MPRSHSATLRKALRTFLLLLLLPMTATAQEPRLPLFEAGISGGAGFLADYPASDEYRARALALPYLIYRGDLLRADDRGVRGRLFRAESLELTLNVNAALGSSSDDSRARRGMPDLDYLGEVGPSLRWVAWRDGEASRISVELPVRAVFSTDFERVRFRGLVLAPEVAIERNNLLLSRSRARIGVGPVFASGLLMDYWYRVAGEFALPDRPAFDAKSGYLGMRAQFSYRAPIADRLAFVVGGRLENFSAATNADSALFRREWNGTVLGGVTYTLYRSAATTAGAAEPFD